MDQRKLRLLSVGSLILLTLLGCWMRTGELNTVFDASGLPQTGHPLTWMLGILSVLWVLASVLFALALPKETRTVKPCTIQLTVQLLAGALVLAGALLALFFQIRTQPVHYRTVLCFLQLLGALCILTAAWAQRGGKRPAAGFYAVICIWQVLVLLLNFRGWSRDPAILDYCFRQFALISGMCAAYHLGALRVEGKGRRMAAFWSMTGCFFAALSILGEDWSWKLTELGMCLWLLIQTWQQFGDEQV